jgi:hypothetical protein
MDNEFTISMAIKDNERKIFIKDSDLEIIVKNYYLQKNIEKDLQSNLKAKIKIMKP